MPEETDDLGTRLAELTGRVTELSAQQNKSLKKTWLDIVSSLSTLIAGGLLTGVGIVATILYDGRESRINHFNSLDKFHPYITSENPVERYFGYEAFVRLGEEEFVIRLISASHDAAGFEVLRKISSSEEGKLPPPVSDAHSPARSAEERRMLAQKAESAVSVLMAAATAPEQVKAPQARLVRGVALTKDGWAYLGHYDKRLKSWKTRYFEFMGDAPPESLKDSTLTVRSETGTLNVRSGMPSPMGQFQTIIDVLAPESEARVVEVSEWQNSGYMWAQIKYGS